MDIWIVNQYAIPPTQAGITRHFSIAMELKRLGHDVTIIASSFDHVTRQETRLEPGQMSKLEVIQGIKFLWLQTPPYPANTTRRVWNMAVFAWRLWRHCGLNERARPDVIVGSSPHLFGAFAAWRVAVRLGVPFVLEIRDLWPASLVELGKLRASHPVVAALRIIERMLYRRATRVITLLPGSSEYIAACGAAPEKIHWVPNGVSLESIQPQPARESKGPLTVMYLGTHGLANALDTLVDAAALLKADSFAGRVVFRLIGDGPSKPALTRRVERDGLNALVRFERPVPKQSVGEVLAQADALIIVWRGGELYQWGISANKIFDYMAAARPVVIAVDTPFNPVAAAGAGLTTPPEDPAAVAAAIKTLCEMSLEERREMGLRGRRYVEVHHDMVQLAKRFEACLLAAAGAADAVSAANTAATPSKSMSASGGGS